MENTLPGSQVLASGESVISKQGFISSMSTFYIKSDFAITNKRLIAHFPNIVLGCLPLGFGNITFNLKQISGVNIEVSYKIFKLLLGVLAIFIGLGSGSGGGVLLGMIVGFVFFSAGIQTRIAVASSGGYTYCPVVFWEKGKAQKLVNELNAAIAENA